MGYAMAGLLQGLGKGVENLGKSIEERRAAALEAARKEAAEARSAATRQAERAQDREYAVADVATNQANAMERLRQGATDAMAAQDDSQEHSSKESGLERSSRLALKKLDISSSVTLENLRSGNNIREAEALAQFNLDNKGPTIDRYVQSEDGTWQGLAMTKDGIKVINTGVKGALPAATAGGVDPITGLPTTAPVAATTPAATTAKPAAPRAGKPDPKYNGFIEVVDYINQSNPQASRDDRLRMAIEQATKYNLPITPRHLKTAKEKGWIK